MQTAVHQLWPPVGERKTEMNILFFDSYPPDPEENRYHPDLEGNRYHPDPEEDSKPRDSEEWKSAWTQRSHPDVFWPVQWLPADLGVDVRVLFALYNSRSRVADVVDDLFEALVIRCASVTT